MECKILLTKKLFINVKYGSLYINKKKKVKPNIYKWVFTDMFKMANKI